MTVFPRVRALVLVSTIAFSACGNGPNQSTNSPQSTPATNIVVTIGHHVAVLSPGGTQTFTATVTGAIASQSTAINWSVRDSGGGSVDRTGHYTAPSAPGVYHVVATSAADSSKTDTAVAVVGILSPDRVAPWNPGIPGGIPTRKTICASIGAPYNDGKTDATMTIQKAIDACPLGQVVSLAAGSYKTTASVTIGRGISLRGAGSTQTKIMANLAPGSVAAIYMRNLIPTYGSPAVSVTADVPRGSTTIPVANGSAFSVGDVVQIDQFDDTSYLYDGNDPYFKRPDYGPPTPAHRSMGQTTMVTAVSGNRLTIADPIHLGFKQSQSPEVFKPDGPMPPAGSNDPPGILERAGLENLYVTGGQNDQIHIEDCAFCWVVGVESDGTTPQATTASNGVAGPGLGMVGAHVLVDKSYRVVVRDSFFHEASKIVQGGGAYGVSLSRHTSESLIENNIIFDMNKPLTMRASGGGNVIGYNYIDNAWTSADPRIQETTLDMGHTSFPYMELVEGNYSPQIATEAVWGNSGWMTIFRNQASSQQKRTAALEKYQIAAISFETGARNMNVLANVLGATGVGLIYQVASNPPGAFQAAVWRLGQGVGAGSGGDDIDAYESPMQSGSTASELFRHANFDYVTGAVTWAPTVATKSLPDSLYLSGKPPFFGTDQWPWVDPVGATKTYVLPAKARFDACTGPSFCP
jgi:hypothetical protein